MKHPYVQMIGVPGSGKSTIESKLTTTSLGNLKALPSAKQPMYIYIARLAMSILFLIICFLVIDWRLNNPISTIRKFIDTGKKYLYLQAQHIGSVVGEGSMTLMLRVASLCLFSRVLVRFFGPMFVALCSDCLYVVLEVEEHVALDRVKKKDRKGKINNLTLESKPFRIRYLRLVDEFRLVLGRSGKANYLVVDTNYADPDVITHDIVERIRNAY